LKLESKTYEKRKNDLAIPERTFFEKVLHLQQQGFTLCHACLGGTGFYCTSDKLVWQVLEFGGMGHSVMLAWFLIVVKQDKS